MKDNKGITLIALVITIIVLLILAGITIAMLTGENGILGNATKAKAYDEIGTAKDNLALKATETVSQYYHDTYVNSTTAVAGDRNVQSLVEAQMTQANATTKVTVSEVSSHKFTITCNDYKVQGTVGTNGSLTWSDIIATTAEFPNT